MAKKKWLVSCRFEERADGDRYCMLVEAKSQSKAIKKAKKAISWSPKARDRARGFGALPMYPFPGGNDDVYYLYKKVLRT